MPGENEGAGSVKRKVPSAGEADGTGLDDSVCGKQSSLLDRDAVDHEAERSLLRFEDAGADLQRGFLRLDELGIRKVVLVGEVSALDADHGDFRAVGSSRDVDGDRDFHLAEVDELEDDTVAVGGLVEDGSRVAVGGELAEAGEVERVRAGVVAVEMLDPVVRSLETNMLLMYRAGTARLSLTTHILMYP